MDISSKIDPNKIIDGPSGHTCVGLTRTGNEWVVGFWYNPEKSEIGSLVERSPDATFLGGITFGNDPKKLMILSNAFKMMAKQLPDNKEIKKDVWNANKYY